MFRSSLKKTLAAVFAGALVCSAAAAPANAQPASFAFTNRQGDVGCELLTVEGVPFVLCRSERARAQMPGCVDPSHQIPAATRSGSGAVHTVCWNQGYTATPARLAPGGTGSGHGYTVVADPLGNLHVFDSSWRYVMFAGGTVGATPVGPSSLSS